MYQILSQSVRFCRHQETFWCFFSVHSVELMHLLRTRKQCRQTAEALISSMRSGNSLNYTTSCIERLRFSCREGNRSCRIYFCNFLVLNNLNLLRDVELMHLLRMCRYYYHVGNTRHWTDFEFAWILSCSFKIFLGHPTYSRRRP